MQNLREIGSRYNDLQDTIDKKKACLRKCKDSEQREKLKKQISEDKQQLRAFTSSLKGEERKAYKDYRAIRREIKHCERMKKYDKVESKVFHIVNPAYIYMIPAAFHSVFFTLMPFLFMIIGAFFKLDLVDIENSQFVRLWNFKMVLTRDNEFWKAFGNTVIFAILTVFLLMVITVLMASWLSSNTKIHNLAQTFVP